MGRASDNRDVIDTVVDAVQDIDFGSVVRSFDRLDFSDVVNVLDGIDFNDVTNLLSKVDLPTVGGVDLDLVVDGLAATSGLFDNTNASNLFDDIRDIKLLNSLGGVFNTVFDEVKDFVNNGEFDKLINDLAGSSIFQGDKGNNTLTGTNDRDILVGKAGRDSISGLGGDDVIAGGRGNDTIRGLAGNDILSGESGDDLLEGGNGRDLISGGSGRNTLTGGKGNDTFVITTDGVGVINDFKIGKDRLGVLSDRDLRNVTFTQQGSNTIVKFDNDTVAILNGISANKLNSNSIGVIDASSLNIG